jgi:membrane-bound lytic murein transglycosylase B
LKQGFARVDSRMASATSTATRLPASGEAMLFLPAGAKGPALLLGPNFFVLKAYNFSDSYAAAVSVLANRIAGGAGVRAAWPKDDGLDAAGRSRIQTLLKQKGFYDGKIDGRFGPITRLAVHEYQKRAGLTPADGFPSKALLARMGGGQ